MAPLNLLYLAASDVSRILPPESCTCSPFSLWLNMVPGCWMRVGGFASTGWSKKSTCKDWFTTRLGWCYRKGTGAATAASEASTATTWSCNGSSSWSPVGHWQASGSPAAPVSRARADQPLWPGGGTARPGPPPGDWVAPFVRRSDGNKKQQELIGVSVIKLYNKSVDGKRPIQFSLCKNARIS